MDERSRIQIKHSLECKDYIEDWFQQVPMLRHSISLQPIFVPNPKMKIISHVHIYNQVHFANLDMSIS